MTQLQIQVDQQTEVEVPTGAAGELLTNHQDRHIAVGTSRDRLSTALPQTIDASAT